MKSVNWTDHILNFVAVILGVSLAFYFSNLAERRKEREETNQIVSSLIEEITADKANYRKSHIPFNQAQSRTILEIIAAIDSKRVDSIEQKINNGLFINSYSPPGVTFNSIISSGKFNLIKDFQLRRALSNYYQILAAEAKARSEVQQEFYFGEMMPWILDHNSLLKPDVKSLVNERKFANLLLLYQGMIDNKVRTYKELAATSDTLILKLEQLRSK